MRKTWIGVLAAFAITGAAWAATPPENGRFHHAHLRVADVARTQAFYGKVFGAVPLSYGGRQPAMVTDRAFIFLDQAEGPIASALQTGLIHIGWAGVDGPSEYAWLQKQGVTFYTPLTPFLRGHFMYLYGPDHEVVEIWTDEKHHRLNHMHLLAADPKATAAWFAKVTHSAAAAAAGPLGSSSVSFGDVTVHVLPDTPALRPKERTGPIQPTDGSSIDHLAFSFRDLDAAYRRVRADGVPVERPLRTDPKTGLRSFFIRAPNGVLVEFIKANPLPDAAWQ